jgi:hypothetical protein
MTVQDILTLTSRAGIVLEARGDRLHVEAPAGSVTPELRDALARLKPEILARLSPVPEFIYLRGGLTVPRPALELAIALEARGFRQRVDAEGRYQIEPSAGLSDGDRARIARWRRHLPGIISYEVPCA